MWVSQDGFPSPQSRFEGHLSIVYPLCYIFTLRLPCTRPKFDTTTVSPSLPPPPDKQNEMELPCPVPKSRERKRRQGQPGQHATPHATLQHQQAGGGGDTLSQISGVRKVSLTSGAVVSRFGVKTDQEELLSKVCTS